MNFLYAIIVLCLVGGCATTEQATITSRDCVITIAQQVAQNAFAANLLCDQEVPVKAEK